MKNIITTIIILVMATALATAQSKGKIIEQSFEISKEVKWMIREHNESFSLPDGVYAHIKQQSFGSAGNIVECWTEKDGYKSQYKILENVKVIKIEGDYIIVDDDFCHFMIFDTKENGMCVGTNTLERNK